MWANVGICIMYKGVQFVMHPAGRIPQDDFFPLMKEPETMEGSGLSPIFFVIAEQSTI